MRILFGVAGGVVFAASICCCGGGEPPTLTVIPGACADAEVVIGVPAGVSRTLKLFVAKGQWVPVEVGFLQTSAQVTVPVGASESVWVVDGDQVTSAAVAGSTPVEVEIGPASPPNAGEEIALDFRVKAELGCSLSGTELVVTAPAETPVTHPLAGRSGTIAISALTEGEHELEWTLWDGRQLSLATGVAAVSVGPPCVDADGDGFLACENDCDDADSDVHPGAVDREGDGVDSDCDGVNGRDADSDGFESDAVGGDDCDDSDGGVHPGAKPVDDDRDGYYLADFAADVDCDGKPDVPPGRGADCDDTRAEVHPGAEEGLIGNRLDDDCDGTVDEGTNLYDDDGDGQTEEEGDCDDDDARRRTGGREIYDCVDNNCDGEVDEGLEATERDDRFEPNDSAARPLSKATRNWLGGYKNTHDVVEIISRDGSDTERFSVVAHDGLLDSFSVDVTLVLGAQNVRYEAVVTRPSGATERSELTENGQLFRVGGTADHSDSGTYQIAITPYNSELAWCPATFRIDTY